MQKPRCDTLIGKRHFIDDQVEYVERQSRNRRTETDQNGLLDARHSEDQVLLGPFRPFAFLGSVLLRECLIFFLPIGWVHLFGDKSPFRLAVAPFAHFLCLPPIHARDKVWSLPAGHLTGTVRRKH